eukprot:7287838-Lingulodinium_polyedra.AAC.1
MSDEEPAMALDLQPFYGDDYEGSPDTEVREELAPVPRPAPASPAPTAQEREAHELSGHAQYAGWCR